MKPPPFRYMAPDSVDEALALLTEHGDEVKPLAGGQSLVPAMNFRLARPAVLVDLNRLAELAFVERLDPGIRLGAMTRQRTVEKNRIVAEAAPLLAETMPHIAHLAIRCRGTIGGSLAHADPAAELPTVCTVLDATMHLRSQRGERTVPAKEFYTGLFATALEPDELLTAITIPDAPERTGFAFEELSRRHGDYALLGVAARVSLDAAGLIERAMLGAFSVGDGPFVPERVSDALAGEAPTPELFRSAAEAAAREADPPSDIHASSAFRRHLLAELGTRVLERACASA